MRGGDLQPFGADRGGHVVQQAGPIAPVHLDDRVCVGGVVVDYHARRHMDRAHAAAQHGFRDLADLGSQAQPARQRLLDQHGKPRQPVR